MASYRMNRYHQTLGDYFRRIPESKKVDRLFFSSG